MSYIVPGADTLQSLFLMKEGQYESSVSSRDSAAGAQAKNYRPFYPVNPTAIKTLKQLQFPH